MDFNKIYVVPCPSTWYRLPLWFIHYSYSVCSDDLQQVCKFADALQTKSAYHVIERDHKMHKSNNVYLKDRQRRSVCFSAKVNITRTKMLGKTWAIKSLAAERY